MNEHTFYEDLLPTNASILDLGCRGFTLNYLKEKGYRVICVDVDEFPGNYYQLAITAIEGWVDIIKSHDPDATQVRPGTQVRTITLQQFSELIGISKWDLIKMDIEGSELDILRCSKHPIAHQVSVEFHAHCGQKKEDIDTLLDYLNYWYRIENAVWDERHGAGFNYWDVLLIVKR